MDDKVIKNVAATVLENKEPIIAILNTLKPEDIKEGKLLIPDDLIVKDLHDYIMNLASPYLEHLMLRFENDAIFVDAIIDIKAVGRLTLDYALMIKEFKFNRFRHFISIAYAENVIPKGNIIQKGLIKAAGIKGDYLNTLLDIIKLPFIANEDNHIVIDLDKSDYAKKIPPELTLEYKGTEDGILHMEFSYVD